MRAFQRDRGLRDHGTCDEPTWLALVEASWRLGDRHLKLIAPSLRGDDVVTVQAQLGRLGFDCGRIDGIFGPATARALVEFQRNCGLDDDGVCGPLTVRALEINGARTGSGPGMAAIRELEQLGTVGASLRDLRVVVGQFGGLGPLTRQVAQSLRQHGANVITVDELDPAIHAATANRHDASVYLGFEPSRHDETGLAYYATSGFESAGGRTLVDRIGIAFAEVDALDPARSTGMRLQVLRETRMTAVVCSLGPVQRVVDAAPAVSAAVVEALALWAAAPLPTSTRM